jgi:hypothetical protein
MRYVIVMRKTDGLEAHWRVDGEVALFDSANDAEWAARNLLAQGMCDEWRVLDTESTAPDGDWRTVAKYPS